MWLIGLNFIIEDGTRKRTIYLLEADVVRRLLSMGICNEDRAHMGLHLLGPSPLLVPPTPVFGAI